MNQYKSRISKCLPLLLILTGSLTITSLAQEKKEETKVEKKKSTKQDVSRPLKDIAPKRENAEGKESVKPLRRINQNQAESQSTNSQPVLANQPAVASPALPQVQVATSLKNDVSNPLRSVTPRRVEAGPFKRVMPLRRIRPDTEGRRPSGALLNDPVSQPSAPTAPTPVGAAIVKKIDGIGVGQGNFRPAASPPDTSGVVGATQYVQWVNNSFAIFDKNTGALVYGPADGNTLFTGFGGPCETSNDGDPIVQYDKAAERWVLSQFSVSGSEPADPNRPAFRQCVAISTTPDATGTYNRYEFKYDDFNDYPKVGVWPNGYYVTFNMFQGSDGPFIGSKVCVYNRESMLNGQPAAQQCIQLGVQFGGVLPSDLDGATTSLRPVNGAPGPGMPPANSPNYLLNFGRNQLRLWTFHVDWANSNNTRLSGPTPMAVAAFNEACDSCITQKDVTQQLDTLGDRLMFRLAYRRLGNRESLLANHAVTTNDGNIGIRWYELRLADQQATVFQQGTFTPDTNHRWMGSIAMDKAGNIGIGYNVSGGSLFPGVRFTGRPASSTLPPGQLQGEMPIKDGAGSQTTFSRWGDYSGMSIDPVDDCTFWFTTEYLKTTGRHNWSTSIVSFKFSTCQ